MLDKEDLDSLSRSQNVIAMQVKGNKGGRVYYSYVFPLLDRITANHRLILK